MQALQAIAQKIDMAAQTAAASGQQAPPQPVNLTVIVDNKTGKTREITQYQRDARGEMVASDKQIIPLEEETPVMAGGA